MKTTVTEKDGRTLIVVEGELDTGTCDKFQSELAPIMERKHVRAEMDMGGVEYISSKAIRIIILLQQRLVAGNGTLLISKVSPMVRDVFDMTGLSRNFLQNEL